jgi:uncharacterized protein YbjT (DUF2867 family)
MRVVPGKRRCRFHGGLSTGPRTAERLVPLLLNARHYVIGTTRSTTKADGLRAAGAEPVVVDVFDAQALSAAVLEAHPDIIVHQLTDLPPGLDPSQMTEGTQRNAHMRSQSSASAVTRALSLVQVWSRPSTSS